MKNVVTQKSFDFAVRIVNLNKYLIKEKREFVLSKQVLKSGTAIGALIREAQYAQSNADFINKMSIALKEASETDYWLLLLHKTQYIKEDHFQSLKANIDELLALLISIVKSAKKIKN